MIKLLAILALFASSVAHAGDVTTMALRTVAPGKTLSLIASTTVLPDVPGTIVRTFAPSDDTKSILIRGDGRNLAFCNGMICNFLWPKTMMAARRCLQCALTMIVTEKDGTTYTLDTKIDQP